MRLATDVLSGGKWDHPAADDNQPWLQAWQMLVLAPLRLDRVSFLRWMVRVFF
jgi:hypothetical protein